ncbi:MAG: proteasome-type protease [Gammaproteobacteria bacterium]|nr:proteasome-type protease [Gammaproteobacteria bacterium]MBU0787071.1 proteasome-type protease [Gammaproteobacteria bacterium]MBU0816322.1 proteasome-type protease [Gammaproteobacteria bacterium]MBU1787959.1 proteasome-type protease [Gammaproteobacteria bacterium]
MTYCVAVRNDAGLVFLSDSRTNAGVDQISTFRKMHTFEVPGERVMVLLTGGNLAISQSVASGLRVQMQNHGEKSLATAPNMFSAAKLVGEAVRKVYERDAEALKNFNVEFNVSLIFGGQIKGEEPRLFNVYSAGNFIEATDETPFFQIGESKYGKPILDRVINKELSLDEVAKCCLISMDSTIKSNLSVGLPLNLLCYERDALSISRHKQIDGKDPYFASIRDRWAEQLRKVFNDLPDPAYWP